MVPEARPYGHSFKGALAYYLHDKRAGERPDTTDRVAWIETRNIAMEGDASFAQSVMIATARNADQLKKDAGVKMTGRKSTAGVVLAYSLAWSPDEAKPDREEMLRAADMSIKFLKAENLQAIIVCHTDTKHPHVHVILNRVDPTNGKISTKDEHRQLSKFREAYEASRGQKLTRSWQEKLQDQDPAKAAPAVNRGDQLAKKQADMKERHRKEWQQLSADNAKKRAHLRDDKSLFLEMAAANREKNKPQLSRLGKAQSQERGEFYRNERSLLGTVANAIRIVTQQKYSVIRGDRRILSMCFAYVISRESRVQALLSGQKMEMEKLKLALDGQFKQEMKTLNTERYSNARKDYESARQMLIDRQDKEKTEMRKAWRDLYADRDRTQTRRHYEHTGSRRPAEPSWKRPTAPSQVTDRRQSEPAWKRPASSSQANDRSSTTPSWKRPQQAQETPAVAPAWKAAAAPTAAPAERSWRDEWKKAADAPSPKAEPATPAAKTPSRDR